MTLHPPAGVQKGDMLEFKVIPVMRDQMVDVYSDGRLLAHWEMTGYNEHLFTVEFPEDFKTILPDLPLRIVVNKTLCPKEEGVNNDSRHLGILFLSAKIKYANRSLTD